MFFNSPQTLFFTRCGLMFGDFTGTECDATSRFGLVRFETKRSGEKTDVRKINPRHTTMRILSNSQNSERLNSMRNPGARALTQSLETR